MLFVVVRVLAQAAEPLTPRRHVRVLVLLGRRIVRIALVQVELRQRGLHVALLLQVGVGVLIRHVLRTVVLLVNIVVRHVRWLHAEHFHGVPNTRRDHGSSVACRGDQTRQRLQRATILPSKRAEQLGRDRRQTWEQVARAQVRQARHRHVDVQAVEVELAPADLLQEPAEARDRDDVGSGDLVLLNEAEVHRQVDVVERLGDVQRHAGQRGPGLRRDRVQPAVQQLARHGSVPEQVPDATLGRGAGRQVVEDVLRVA